MTTREEMIATEALTRRLMQLMREAGMEPDHQAATAAVCLGAMISATIGIKRSDWMEACGALYDTCVEITGFQGT